MTSKRMIPMAQPFSLPLNPLTEPSAIAIAQAIECQAILTPLCEEAIATTYVHKSGGTVPIVLLHGFDSSVLEFRRLLPLLATQYDTWAIDLLGFGFTARPLQVRVSPEAIKAHLYAFWKARIGQPVILVGASMGGAAAIDFTLSFPEAVRQLVLIDSAGLSAGPSLSKLMVKPLDQWATAFLRSLKVRQKVSLKAYFDPALASLEALTCGALHLEQAGWQEALISFTQSGGYRSFKTRLHQIEPQTLIIWGKNDRILGTKDAQRFRQAISGSQLIWIPQCGHVPHLEQPQATAQHILTFAEQFSRSGIPC
jgi:pimeloyl-ACP methyl ester carboxylesterase